MQIQKIFCDICGKEIDLTKDNEMAMYEFISAKQIATFTAEQQPQKPEINKKTYEICMNCNNKILAFIDELRTKNNTINLTEDNVKIKVKL